MLVRYPAEKIDEIVDSLIKVYHPLEIYLFGSYAWGKPDKDSDIDFAVIVDESNLDMASRIRLSFDALWGIGISTDIIVYTKSELIEKSKYRSTLQHRILTDGKKVYEAA